MKNNKFVKRNIIKIIDNLYKLSGRKEIPNVKKVCSEANVDRQTAIKFLYAWWSKYYSVYRGKKNQVEKLPDAFLFEKKIEENALVKVNAAVQCLIEEIVLYSEALNNLAYFRFPLGNLILSSLHEIENQIFIERGRIDELEKSEQFVKDELKNALEENNHSHAAYALLQKQTNKELKELEKKYDTSRREAMTASHRLKSIKRNKRRGLKKLFNDFSIS